MLENDVYIYKQCTHTIITTLYNSILYIRGTISYILKYIGQFILYHIIQHLHSCFLVNSKVLQYTSCYELM